MGDRVLITGGAGLVGSHIVDLLIRGEMASPPDEIVVLDNFSRGMPDNLRWGLSHGPVRVVEGDLRDRALFADLLKGVSVVFHQAAVRITECAENPRLAVDVLAGGTFNLVEAAVRAGVRKIIAASSASIYGMAEQFPTAENHHPYNNLTLYGAAKAFNEALLRSFHEMHGLDYVALRYFNVYGPRMDIYGAYTEVLIRWIERIAAGRPPIILGDGKQTMDFVYVGDVARANVLAASRPVTNQVFNIASGTETTLEDLAKSLLDVMDSRLAPQYGPARKVNSVPRRLADVGKAKTLLGFTAQTPLNEGLTRLVQWWQELRSRM